MPLAAAVGAGLLARGAWSTYFELLPANQPRSPTYEYSLWYARSFREAVGFYPTAGWMVLVATGLLLIAGVVLAVKAIRGSGPANRQGADTAVR
jgi:hypothetical protein